MHTGYRVWTKFLSVGVAMAICITASAESADAKAYLDALRTEFDYPGVSAAVAIDGELAWAGASGYADVDTEREATADTVYRLGSVSKRITIAALLLLYQEGKLVLDAPVQRHVPEYPEKDKGAITTRLLAGHLAGVPHYMAGDKLDTKRPNYTSVIDAIAEYRDKPQLDVPGARYQYSTYGYSLISAVVERAANTPFPEYLQESVFTPIGLSDTRVERAGESVPRIATFYKRTGAREIGEVDQMYLSYKWAGGGMLSTVEDLVKFGTAWLPGSALFTEDALELTFTSQKTADGEETGVGLGWRINRIEDETRLVYHHGGAIDGGRAFIAVFPEERTVVALLANMLGARNFGLTEAVGILDAVNE